MQLEAAACSSRQVHARRALFCDLHRQSPEINRRGLQRGGKRAGWARSLSERTRGGMLEEEGTRGVSESRASGRAQETAAHTACCACS